MLVRLLDQFDPNFKRSRFQFHVLFPPLARSQRPRRWNMCSNAFYEAHCCNIKQHVAPTGTARHVHGVFECPTRLMNDRSAPPNYDCYHYCCCYFLAPFPCSSEMKSGCDASVDVAYTQLRVAPSVYKFCLHLLQAHLHVHICRYTYKLAGRWAVAFFPLP